MIWTYDINHICHITITITIYTIYTIYILYIYYIYTIYILYIYYIYYIYSAGHLIRIFSAILFTCIIYQKSIKCIGTILNLSSLVSFLDRKIHSVAVVIQTRTLVRGFLPNHLKYLPCHKKYFSALYPNNSKSSL